MTRLRAATYLLTCAPLVLALSPAAAQIEPVRLSAEQDLSSLSIEELARIHEAAIPRRMEGTAAEVDAALHSEVALP